MKLNVHKTKLDFPIFERKVNGKRLVYLDNASTTHKPWQVCEEMDVYYCHSNANIHRGIHTLAEESTKMYEDVREKVRSFINAKHLEEVVFNHGATEALNLIAWSWGMKNVQAGDEIVLTELEHHANLLPWQRVAQVRQATLKFIPVGQDGSLDLSDLNSILSQKTKIVALTHASNALGVINPVDEIISQAKKVGAAVVLDAAQSVPHMPVDVQKIGADFVVFSAHKMLGPTGTGVMYGRKELLEEMDPFMVGGEMIREVDYDSASWHDLPWKFEAGTPNIAGVIGLGRAIEYLEKIGMTTVREHEEKLTAHALQALGTLDGVRIYGPLDVSRRAGVVSFNVEGIHAHDLGTMLDEDGVAIRSGHHCAQPLAKKMGVAATARASFYIYNDESDIEVLVHSIRRAQRVFSQGK